MGKTTKEKRDIYYRLARSEGYRARSAYKLIQIDEHYGLFNQDVQRIVDLCAAPGSWSQVLSAKLREESKIVAVDLQPMAPLPGVVQIVGDITRNEVAQEVLDQFDGVKADLVVCDGAPDVTGLNDLDEYLQGELLLSALHITLCLLRPGGTFVAKIFRGRDIDLLFGQLVRFFRHVECAKPRSSRNSSIESFVVCRDYAPPADFVPDLTKPFTSPLDQTEHRATVAFVACGDVDDWGDADMSYPAPEARPGEEVADVIAPPTAPPYKEWQEKRRRGEI